MLGAYLCRGVDAVDARLDAPCIVLLRALNLWGPLAALVACTSSSLIACVWASVPHHLPTGLCAQLLHTSASVCACHILLLEASQQAADARQDLLAVRLALYAVSASLRCFDAVAGLLEVGLDVSALEGTGCWASLSTAAQAAAAAAESGGQVESDHASSLAREYSWSRLHMLVLDRMRAAICTTPPRSPTCGTSLRIAVHEARDFRASSTAESLIAHWLLLARVASRELASRLPASAYPLDTEALGGGAAANRVIARLWLQLSGGSGPGVAAPPSSDGTEAQPEHTTSASDQDASVASATAIWPLDDESPGTLVAASSQESHQSLRVSPPLQLLLRKGDFVRAVCVNALNHRQLAVSLSKGVHQLEITEHLPGLEPGTPSEQAAPQSQWSTWGAGVKNAAKMHQAYLAGAEASPLTSLPEQPEVRVHQSSGNDVTARCLCSHPKVRLAASIARRRWPSESAVTSR